MLSSHVSKYFWEVKDTRWLSQVMAVSNLQRNLSAALAALAEETELKKCPTAKGMCSFLAIYRFVASVYLQADVLPHFSKLSKVFQKENVNFLTLKDQVLNQYFIFDTIDHTLLILIRYLQLRLYLLCLTVIRSL